MATRDSINAFTSQAAPFYFQNTFTHQAGNLTVGKASCDSVINQAKTKNEVIAFSNQEV
jgi:hypothetical protein